MNLPKQVFRPDLTVIGERLSSRSSGASSSCILIEQVDRVRVARLLIEEMAVNLEGAEVVLHMRAQMIAMQRQFNEVLRLLGQD